VALGRQRDLRQRNFTDRGPQSGERHLGPVGRELGQLPPRHRSLITRVRSKQRVDLRRPVATCDWPFACILQLVVRAITELRVGGEEWEGVS
jgi:hypothetical protein